MALGEDETVLLVKKNLSTTYRVRQGSISPKITSPNFDSLQAEEAVDCERMWLEDLESTEGDRDGKKAKNFHQHLGYRSLSEGSAVLTHRFLGLADGFAFFVSMPQETTVVSVYSLESGEKAWSIDLPLVEWAGGTINLINFIHPAVPLHFFFFRFGKRLQLFPHLGQRRAFRTCPVGSVGKDRGRPHGQGFLPLSL